MSTKPFKTLFLCTTNSARSIFAEYFLRHEAGDIFDVSSAGTTPKDAPDPLILKILAEDFHIDVSGARSKSWEEFRDVHFDLVITLCDDAKEECPVWPGQPIVAHWSSPDPSSITGDDKTRHDAYWQVAQQIHRRVSLLATLPVDKLDALHMEAEAHAIGSQ